MRLGPIQLVMTPSPDFSAGIINVVLSVNFSIYTRRDNFQLHRFSIGARLLFWHFALYFWRIPERRG